MLPNVVSASSGILTQQITRALRPPKTANISRKMKRRPLALKARLSLLGKRLRALTLPPQGLLLNVAV